MNFSPKNPPPLSYQLFCGVHCPQCGEHLSFVPLPTSERKQVYCANPKCTLLSFTYYIKLNDKTCEVVA
jgi:hypothetical protein